jgi:predicted ABC-type ATPase
LPFEAGCPAFINADLIAAGLSPFQPETATFRAGRLMLEEITTHVAAGKSFAFETTLSSLIYARMIPQWRAANYVVKLVFLSLASPEEAMARVAMRVRQGGHSVPPKIIHRRFAAGLRNFHNIYRQRVDYWQWFDNSGPVPRLLEEGGNP